MTKYTMKCSPTERASLSPPISKKLSAVLLSPQEKKKATMPPYGHKWYCNSMDVVVFGYLKKYWLYSVCSMGQIQKRNGILIQSLCIFTIFFSKKSKLTKTFQKKNNKKQVNWTFPTFTWESSYCIIETPRRHNTDTTIQISISSFYASLPFHIKIRQQRWSSYSTLG